MISFMYIFKIQALRWILNCILYFQSRILEIINGVYESDYSSKRLTITLLLLLFALIKSTKLIIINKWELETLYYYYYYYSWIK